MNQKMNMKIKMENKIKSKTKTRRKQGNEKGNAPSRDRTCDLRVIRTRCSTDFRGDGPRSRVGKRFFSDFKI